MSEDPTDSEPRGIQAPPDRIATPPVSSRAHSLPFGELTWENFERLCHRLAQSDGAIEHCARFGLQGEAQAGIDIFARRADGAYDCWQAKRHKSFGASELRDAVALFEQGSWAARSRRFVVAVQAPLQSTGVQEEIERLAARLKAEGITFLAWDGEALTEALRDRPELIDDFFGRGWVEALLGVEAAQRIRNRLDGGDFARVRDQLGRVYSEQFHFIDPGSFGSIGRDEGRRALTILERFMAPDLLVREDRAAGSNDAERLGDRASALPEDQPTERNRGPLATRISTTQTRRIDMHGWLASGDRFAIIGDAGSGKSTILRAVALDILHDQRLFPDLARRWGRLLPLHISFARWSREIASHGAEIGLKGIAHRALQPFLTADLVDLLDRAIDERRIILLIDGLDEWSDEQPARTALASLVTTVGAHEIPTIVTGRPRGMARIGNLPSGWKRAAIAPLSIPQQAAIAGPWFDRYAPGPVSKAPTAQDRPRRHPDRTASFMGELARDRSLITLGETPLLLIGLITLRLRGQVLPRSRIEAYRQLVALLLETHPQSRATAAGDVQPRFRHADDPEQRRAAVAYLAYSIRREAGDAGFPLERARSLLRDYLASTDGFQLEPARASAAATEILAVNAETQGIIVEKAPDEVGFAHASFEEFLSAEHLCGLSFEELRRFVEIEAGNPRWRNVIVNSLGILQRRDEIDSLVATIEAPGADALGNEYRQGLLAEVGFTSAGRSPATARRLAEDAMHRIELSDWMPGRADALRSALKSLGDPALGPLVEGRLSGWTPSRPFYRSSLIQALGDWSRSPDVADVVWRAFHDDDRAIQRSAATAYLDLHNGDLQAADRLVEAIKRTTRPSVAAAMLESLLLGWPEHPRLEALLRDARSSISAPLRLVGIAGLAARGETPAETRDEVLELCGFWSGLDYADQPLVLHLLIKYWKDDETLITGAVDMLEQRQHPSVWEFTDAKAYLLHCSTDQHKVRQWLLRELEKPRSINIMGLDNVWTRVGLFAKDDPRLLEPAVASWNQPEQRMMHLREIVGFVQSVRDSRIRDILIDVVRGKEDFQKHWAAKALVTAWGRDDPAVAGLFDEILTWPAERLINLAAVLPDIDPDRQACRQRLLDLSRDPLVRRDLLAVGLEACGCDGSDDAAVQALLQPSQRSVYSPMAVLGRSFNTHPDVRALAGMSLKAPEPPWVALATGFGDEPEVREALLRAAAPLPLELRTVIAETAVAGGVGTSLDSTLQHYELESDPELMVRLSIAYHRALVAAGRQADAIPKLEAQLLSYGSDLEPLRAAALAGATIIGELTRVAGLEEQGRLANIVFTTTLHPLPSMVRLVSEQWQSFRAAFGDTLEERLKTFSENGVKHTLACGAALSEAASSEFLASAEAGTMARTPTALRTLAMLRPASPLLLTRCLEALDREHGRNDYMTVKAEIALILAEQFGGDAAVRDQLVERMRHSHSSASVLALALHSPGDPALAALPEIRVPQRELGQWATIVHIAASFASATEFAQLVETLVTRSRRIQFDAQKISNLGIERRLRRDPEVAELLGRMVDPKAHPSILASIPRYLAATGTLGEKERAKVLDALGMFARDQIVPLAGYDAVADRVRSVRLSMLDALHSGAEI